MVDQKLLAELKELRAHPDKATTKDGLKIFEIFKQLSTENDELRESVEDADICMQFVMIDEDFKYWISARDGKIEYGEGEGPDVSVTLKAKRATLAGMLSREIDATSAYMSGDLVIEGKLQDAMKFGEISDIAGDIITDLLEK